MGDQHPVPAVNCAADDSLQQRLTRTVDTWLRTEGPRSRIVHVAGDESVMHLNDDGAPMDPWPAKLRRICPDVAPETLVALMMLADLLQMTGDPPVPTVYDVATWTGFDPIDLQNLKQLPWDEEAGCVGLAVQYHDLLTSWEEVTGNP